jgi:hypothetical protein
MGEVAPVRDPEHWQGAQEAEDARIGQQAEHVGLREQLNHSCAFLLLGAAWQVTGA